MFSTHEPNRLGLILFASAGILAVMAGFASQAAFSNIIGGVLVLIFKPFGGGGTVKIDNTCIGMVGGYYATT